MESTLRSGKCVTEDTDHLRKVKFGAITNYGKNTSTDAIIIGLPWAIIDYGDTIPGAKEDPINDIFGDAVNGGNQCLTVHLAAGEVHSYHSDPLSFGTSSVMRMSRKVRWGQYNLAHRCHTEIGPLTDSEPLAIVELMAHAHDALHPPP